MPVARHKTAIGRATLSRPLRLALEAKLVHRDTTVLDYGCGRGDDLRHLNELDIPAVGWDPAYRTSTPLQPADVVNLGYVVNVIEDPDERAQTLALAWGLARRLLIVAARLHHEADFSRTERLSDGVLTVRDTFQKVFSQRELAEWIDETLGVQSIPASPGVFFVFRDDEAKSTYLMARYRRRATSPKPRLSDLLFQNHRDLLDPILAFFSERGRLPRDEELPDADQVSEVFGSIRRAFQVVKRATNDSHWHTLRAQKKDDLLVYLALERFGSRPRFSSLPTAVQLDVRDFFSSYKNACRKADELLFAAGDMERVDALIRESRLGKRTPNALYVHVDALSRLAPELRVYEGCARRYLGVVDHANVIKLRRRKPQISYLAYPDFDKDPHPVLHGVLWFALGSRDLRYRSYTDSANPPILHRKEVFLDENDSRYRTFERLTRQEERRGLLDRPDIGTRQRWQTLLASEGLLLRGHRLILADKN